ncbi:MAG TPA: PilZ domain-containing protein [Candidatus Methylomirabilis sp.]|nr:PilZ domain-containing protein [Candidatus Methylomirabilis sp.]
MPKSHPQAETIHSPTGPCREFSRIPVVIPVRVNILPASRGDANVAVPAVLLNISCGGGTVRLRWDLPPGTRVFISWSVGTPEVHLPAEIVWGARASGLWNEPTMYGIRWVNPLSAGAVRAVLLGQGLTRRGEKQHAPRV